MTVAVLGSFTAPSPVSTLLQDPTVNQSLSCLKKSMKEDGFPNVYTTALMAYVFTLAGDMETRSRLLYQLKMEAKRKGQLVSSWELGGA